MKVLFRGIQYAVLAAVVFLSGCYYGPVYPWKLCPANGPYLVGCYPVAPCTTYHPNFYYRCFNNHCGFYSPYAPNKCDPFPYYTNCRYTACCQGNYTPDF